MTKFFLSGIFIFLSLTFQVFARQTDQERVSGIFSGLSFDRFAKMIEDQSAFRLYYLSEDVEGLVVNVNAYESLISDLLQEILSPAGIYFTIDSQHRIFLSKERPLSVNLRADFFNRQKQDDADSENTAGDAGSKNRNFSKNRLWEVGDGSTRPERANGTISGRVTSFESGEPIIGALVYTSGQEARSITDESGNYVITLPKGRHTLIFQNFGAYQEQRQINLSGDGRLDVAMDDNIISLSEVTVTSEKSANIERPEMGLANITVQSLKKLPAVLGEVDVLRAVLTLPGVKTVGEASAGFNVRGGAADQNLILYNEATVYNPTHLFGMFSAFNPDMIESVDLYKAGIPVQFGGRLSSVLDVKSKFGNKEKIQGGGGIGLMTSRMYVEGPLSANTSFAIGGRGTYSNWLFGFLDEDSEFRDSRASFHDLNLNFKHSPDPNNEFRLSAYWSQDAFRFDRDTSFNYQNLNINVGWTHYFNDKLEGHFHLGHDQYGFGILSEQDPLNAFRFGFAMDQSSWKNHFTYELSDKHRLSFGMNHLFYNLNPGKQTPQGPESIVLNERVNREKALESAFYIGDEFEVNPKLLINYGMRYVIYNYLGPNSINEYPFNSIRTEDTKTGESSYGAGEIINTYHGPEIRISARYAIDNFTSVKAGFNTMRQHLHMLTNTAAIAPTDTWKLSDPYLMPQTGRQFAIGYFKNFKNNVIETSAEVYYRNMQNLVDFRSGATLILNNDLEQDVLNTRGRAYGIELMAKKTQGKLNGWISYTYSRSLLQTNPEEWGEQVNSGKWYPSNFDQPHDIMLAGNFEFTKRINTSLNANYSTGRPITYPVAKFNYNGSERVFYSDRNAYRILDYFRVDLSFNIEGNHKIRKLAHASWSLGIYNILGRANPYSVYFSPVNGNIQGYQLSIFARPIPFVTYNFRF
ncbi:TonB-dependent Receptor Plug Domain [Cyclobacterium lianum]|uniref:TonB-dependent Receptor Plug Domain n=1 Tax=Cyclobacterium lianum TaxID=388280 RepID=A0A1M7MPA2_9BACT|nr:TonB-dependent receptor [Cyclobacterium lianum]SHM92755.1 TonB-dependent Receptor Plug Domain [Cyclobacterium lianum]